MLRFSLAGVPVGVHVSFLIVALLAYPQLTGADLIAWTAAVFLAVLLHESGHAFTARGYGAGPVAITLFALGGVTTYPDDGRLTPWRRFAISAAGSGVGIVVGGALWLLLRQGVFDGLERVVRVGIGSFIFASLFWGVLNWLPIRPLDGSHMVRSALDALVPRRAEAISWGISLVVGIGAVIVAVRYRQYFAAVFAAVLTLTGLRRDPSRTGDARDTGHAGIGGERAEPRSVEGAPRRSTPDTSGDPPSFPI